MLNCRIKSECGSIQRQLFDEFFAKWVTILALIEDMNVTEVLHDGDTRSGIQDDPEMMQTSQPPRKRRGQREAVFGQNIIIIETIKLHLGDLRPKS